jgi:hypothetical protein
MSGNTEVIETMTTEVGFQKEPINIPNVDFRILMLRMERAMRKHENCVTPDVFPLKHTFANGMYIREIFCPKGSMILSYVHKHSNPAFLLEGEITIIGPDGNKRVKAPYSFISPSGSQRIVFHHEDTRFATVHLNITNERDIDKIEKEIYVPHYSELTKEETNETPLLS